MEAEIAEATCPYSCSWSVVGVRTESKSAWPQSLFQLLPFSAFYLSLILMWLFFFLFLFLFLSFCIEHLFVFSDDEISCSIPWMHLYNKYFCPLTGLFCSAYAKISPAFQIWWFLGGHIYCLFQLTPVPCLVQLSRFRDTVGGARAAEETSSGKDSYR